MGSRRDILGVYRPLC